MFAFPGFLDALLTGAIDFTSDERFLVLLAHGKVTGDTPMKNEAIRVVTMPDYAYRTKVANGGVHVADFAISCEWTEGGAPKGDSLVFWWLNGKTEWSFVVPLNELCIVRCGKTKYGMVIFDGKPVLQLGAVTR